MPFTRPLITSGHALMSGYDVKLFVRNYATSVWIIYMECVCKVLATQFVVQLSVPHLNGGARVLIICNILINNLANSMKVVFVFNNMLK